MLIWYNAKIIPKYSKKSYNSTWQIEILYYNRIKGSGTPFKKRGTQFTFQLCFSFLLVRRSVNRNMRPKALGERAARMRGEGIMIILSKVVIYVDLL